MKKIKIHIGTFKTATSTIQRALSSGNGLNSEVFSYIGSGRKAGSIKHLMLYDSLIDDNTNTRRRANLAFDKIKKSIQDEISSSSRSIFVLSDEELSYPSAEIAEQLEFLRDLGARQGSCRLNHAIPARLS